VCALTRPGLSPLLERQDGPQLSLAPVSRRQATLVVLIVCALSSCERSIPALENRSQHRQLEERHIELATPGDVLGMEWFSERSIAVGFRPASEDSVSATSIWLLDPDSSDFRRLPLGEDPECSFVTLDGTPSNITDYGVAGALPDGRLGILRRCRSSKAPHAILAFDPSSERVEPLIPSLGELFGRFGLGSISWGPTLEKAIATHSSGICASIAWIKSGGLEPIPQRMSDGGRSWRLDEDFVDPGDCGRRGRAANATWSRQRNQIAFLASPESIGRDGQARLDVPWHIYLTNPDDLNPRAILRNILHPIDLTWSPDGRFLAFNAEASGIYVFELTTKRLIQVSRKGRDGALQWSPDGQELVFTESVEKFPARERQNIAILDMRPIQE
jgi:hypothetical protein